MRSMKPIESSLTPTLIQPVPGDYLLCRYHEKEDAIQSITVGMGDNWSVLACKEVYGVAVKELLRLKLNQCSLDLTPALQLGDQGLMAALEGFYGGSYEKKYALTDQRVPQLSWSPVGLEKTDPRLQQAVALAESVLWARNLVNCPANRLTPALFSEALVREFEPLPVETEVYDRSALKELGLEALLAVGDSSANPPALVVLRYNGNPSSDKRLGFVGKGVTVDSGGYCLKAANSMEGIKGDLGGAAAMASALRSVALSRLPLNLTVVIPTCENRISPNSLLPGDVIGSLSGKTIEVLNSDAEGRLILADGITWAIQKEQCTHLVDCATLTGAMWAVLGFVTTGVLSNEEDWFNQLLEASKASGEKFWRLPAFPEYDRLIDSDYASVRNTSKDGCGAITAGLFLQRFVQGLPWLHLDIAGTADNKGIVWEHQVPGATGTPTPTLYHLARLFGESQSR